MIITDSKQEGNTYFIFREISENIYKEVKFKIVRDEILCSDILLPKEIKFIRVNFIEGLFKLNDSILNFRSYDSKLNGIKSK